MKPCKLCGEVLPFDSFYRHSSNKDGRQNRCKPCVVDLARNSQLRTKYGITMADFEELLEKQGGVCALCGNPPGFTGRSDARLNVDHDHETGEIRALLCMKCNCGLGNFRDDPDLLLAAILYLWEHHGERRRDIDAQLRNLHTRTTPLPS